MTFSRVKHCNMWWSLRDKRMALRDGIDTDYDEGDQFEEETVRESQLNFTILRFAKTLISPRLSSWSRRRKQSSKIRKKIQDETKHSFDQWICLKLKVIRCSTVHELDLLIVRIHCYGQVHLDPNWPIIIIRLFWWFSLVNQSLLGKLTGSKLENVQCILYINL